MLFEEIQQTLEFAGRLYDVAASTSFDQYLERLRNEIPKNRQEKLDNERIYIYLGGYARQLSRDDFGRMILNGFSPYYLELYESLRGGDEEDVSRSLQKVFDTDDRDVSADYPQCAQALKTLAASMDAPSFCRSMTKGNLV